METWGQLLQDAAKVVLGDQKPKNLYIYIYNRNSTVTGMSMSCLDRVRTANLGTEKLRRIIRIYHWFKTQTSTLEFELDCDSRLNNPRLPTLWSLYDLNVLAKMNTGNLAGMDSLNKHVEQISFRQCLTFCKHRQLKRWQPHFQPTKAKSFLCSRHRDHKNSVTKPFASLHETDLSSAAATKGWAWYKHNLHAA